ncbi:MAG: ribose 5-phosphate isomerase B [Anaerolineales bacterium]|jgi:ribose 5-phosphate isomerase B
MPDEKRIRRMVSRVVHRTLGLTGPSTAPRRRPLVTELDIRNLPHGATYEVPEGALITPLARQVAMDLSVNLVEMAGAATAPPAAVKKPSAGPQGSVERAIAIGADHGGYKLKEELKAQLAGWGYTVVDCGTDSESSVDYPDFAFAVAELVANGSAWRGIIIDGAGIGSCMAANKVPGVLAAMCYDQATAVNSREHNNANVLTLGAGLLGTNLALQITKTWLDTKFGGGRHARRVDKITQIESRFCR